MPNLTLARRPPPEIRAANRLSPRAALTAIFALNGFVFGSWASRIPDVTTQVAATHTTLGLALLCVSLGALLTMQPAGRLCARIGAARLTVASAALLCAAAALPGRAETTVQLGGILVVFGAASGLMNVAMNSLGVDLESREDRPLLPLLHAAASFGGLAGALSGGLAATYASPPLHLLAVGLIGLVLVASTASTLGRVGQPAPRQPDAERRPPLAGAVRSTVVLLGVIAGCTAYSEGALSDWATLHLAEDLHATAVLAATGYACFSLAMGCGRLAGGRLIAAVGETPLIVGGAVVAALSMVVAALTPSIPTALIGLGLVGLGLANIFPIAIARAGAEGGSSGVALASMVGYAGLLGGPPLIGFLAAHVGLPFALTTISALSLAAATLALVVHSRRSTDLARSAWYRAALLARPGQPVAAATLGLKLTAERHARSLVHLDPSPGLGAGSVGMTVPNSVGPTPRPDAQAKAPLRRWLTTGVGYSVPFVVAGGILIALAYGLGGPEIAAQVQGGSFAGTTYPGISDPARIFAEVGLAGVLFQIGTAALSLLVPVLAGFTAYAMAGPQALVAGVVGGLLADLVGAGYLCGLLAGLLAGGVVLFLTRLPDHHAVAGVVRVVGVPVVSTVVVGLAVVLVLGPPVAAAQQQLTAGLHNLSGSNSLLIGVLLGLMMAFDIGGPVNKAAYAFALAALGQGEPQFIAAVMAAGMSAPLAVALASAVRPRLFTESERSAGKASWLLGACFVTEGAIPFVAADPLRVLPSLMLGSAAAGGFSMAVGVTTLAPHGGVWAIGLSSSPLLWLAAVLVGTLISATCVCAAKSVRAR